MKREKRYRFRILFHWITLASLPLSQETAAEIVRAFGLTDLGNILTIRKGPLRFEFSLANETDGSRL